MVTVEGERERGDWGDCDHKPEGGKIALGKLLWSICTYMKPDEHSIHLQL